MSVESARQVLLDILASNPSVVYKGMGVYKSETLFKVVLEAPIHYYEKMDLIRMFRFITKAGLVEAKAWTEGKPYGDIPSGVIAQNLTRSQADRIATEINKTEIHSPIGVAGTSIRVKVVSH
jgi:ribosomal protein L7/L12